MNGHQNPEEMQKLQQEAVRRAQEMQARARTPQRDPRGSGSVSREQRHPEFFVGGVHSAGDQPQEEPEREEQSIGHPPAPPPEPRPMPPIPHQKGMQDIFGALMSDSERTMILVLILLLVNEGADMGLVLALMYLII